jgi:hypothetical protein
VVDLARGQIAQGHCVGIVADSSSGGTQADATLAALAPKLALGLMRIAMSRQLGPKDVAACAHVARRAADVAADVVHGHGAKGGAYARLARASRAIRAYTPHGGSLHYNWSTPGGFLYLAAEREMMPRTELFLFESEYGRDVFRAKVGDPGTRGRVVHNGVAAAEFLPVATDPEATDLVFVGELEKVLTATHSSPRRNVSARPSGSSAPNPRARRSHSDGCWSCPRVRNRCPISCSRQPPQAFP